MEKRFVGEWSARTALAIGVTAWLLSCTDDVDPGWPLAYEPVESLPAIQAGLTIELAQGVLQGASDRGDMRRFKGIPFAMPPTGTRRFMAPEPHTGWDGVLDASMRRDGCLRLDLTTGELAPAGSEDCLFVNVYTPDPAPAEHLPVMFWLHGGAFVSGQGGSLFYEGDQLIAARDVVVVTVNYRLGPAGFIAVDGGADNAGLLDVVEALRWTRENIGHFGGDPNNVTLFGESAGAVLTGLLMTMPETAGLYHKALMQSAPLAAVPTRSAAERLTRALIEQVGCGAAADTLACLRDLDGPTLVGGLDLPQSLPGGLYWGTHSSPLWWPFLDGEVLKEQPFAAFDRGEVVRVPTLLGSNSAEGVLFHSQLIGDVSVTSNVEFEAALRRRLSDEQLEAVLAVYEVDDFADFDDALGEITGDAAITCPTRRIARGLARTGQPVYRYYYDQPASGAIVLQGAFHGSELPYVFGHNAGIGLGDVRGSGLEVSAAMRAWWTGFATTGDPNYGMDLTWPRYRANRERYMVIRTEFEVSRGVAAERCDVLDAIPLELSQLGLP